MDLVGYASRVPSSRGVRVPRAKRIARRRRTPRRSHVGYASRVPSSRGVRVPRAKKSHAGGVRHGGARGVRVPRARSLVTQSRSPNWGGVAVTVRSVPGCYLDSGPRGLIGLRLRVQYRCRPEKLAAEATLVALCDVDPRQGSGRLASGCPAPVSTRTRRDARAAQLDFLEICRRAARSRAGRAGRRARPPHPLPEAGGFGPVRPARNDRKLPIGRSPPDDPRELAVPPLVSPPPGRTRRRYDRPADWIRLSHPDARG